MNSKSLGIAAWTLLLSLAASSALASFVQQGPKLVGTGAVGQAYQGYAVAVSADGSTAIVSGPVDNGGVGAAWVYTHSGGVWSQQGTKLVGTGAIGAAQQGISVALSADGNTAMVGGISDDSGVGAVWVYTRSAGVWSQQGAKLVGSGSSGVMSQGYSVALSADGNTAIVGGPNADNQMGAVWAWTRSAGVWTQQGAKFAGTGLASPPNNTPPNQGISVALSADGSTAAVGGNWDDVGTGAVWVFTRSAGVWSQQGDKLVGPLWCCAARPKQGSSVAVSADGNTIISGGPHWLGTSSGPGWGAVWVWARNGGVWTQQGDRLIPETAFGTNSAQMGTSVAMAADGNTFLAGAPGDSGDTGATWVWARAGGVWSRQGAKLIGTGAVGAALQGWSVSVSADGNTAIAGGYGDTGNAGGAWLFVQPPSIAGIVTTECPTATPAAGVEVRLLQSDTPFASTITAADGSYGFRNVPPGTYIVAVTAPAGYASSIDTRLVTLDVPDAAVTVEPFTFTCVLGDVAGSVMGSCGGRGDCNDDGECDSHDSESAGCQGHGDCNHDGRVDSDDGICEMTSSGLLGVTVDLFSIDPQGHEALVAVTATGPGGAYHFPGVAMGDYHVSIVKPLGYTENAGSQVVHLTTPGGTVNAGFALTCMNIESEPRTVEYWKHQVNVYLTGKGKTQESLIGLLGYIDLMFQHFNQNLINPVIVYVPISTNTQDKLRQLQQLLTVNRSGTVLDQAKQQLLALLLNVVSNKISQVQVISDNGATVSQAITHAYDLIVDTNSSNDGTAATFCERINDGEHVPNGMVPVTTRAITYSIKPPVGETATLRFEGIHPSPARGAFTVDFSLKGEGPASLEVVDISGRRVLRQDLGGLGAGRHSLRSAEWAPLASGVYVVRLSEAGRSLSRTISVVR